ncbi:alpha/beta fold hydrolase, partial [Salmonella enterica]
KMNYKILLHDFKGQLKSEKPKGPYSFKEHAYESKLLMDELDIKKVHIIGTSYGGEVALRFAIDYPQYVKSISIIDSVSELDETLKYF